VRTDLVFLSLGMDGNAAEFTRQHPFQAYAEF